MEKYKKNIKKRAVFMGAVIAGLVVLYIVCVILKKQFPFVDEQVADMYLGFQTGLSASIGTTLAIGIRKIQKALKDEGKIKELYIEEHDERKKEIGFRMAVSGVTVILLTLVAAVFITAYINKTVFLTLLTVTAGMSVILVTFKLYYHKKL